MINSTAQEIRFAVSKKAGEVSGLLLMPKGAKVLLVVAHGAGAGMRHRFMEQICAKLAEREVATLRYQFPYMEKGIKRPDPEAVLTATVRSAAGAAKEFARGMPVFAGGKSMGGRMTSLAAAKESLDGIKGLIFFGFPLHAAGKPSAERGKHLSDIDVAMLFLQGSRDTLADLKLLKPLCQRLGKRAELFIVDGGDHSFHKLKSSGSSEDAVLDEVAERTTSWMSRLIL
jgi:uncharacterized protein